MTLISCAECGKEVSARAARCPHCGMKLAKDPVWQMVILSVIAVPAAAIIVLLVLGESEAKRQERYQKTRTECIELASKIAVGAQGLFSAAHETIAIRTVKDCMASRGFEVNPK